MEPWVGCLDSFRDVGGDLWAVCKVESSACASPSEVYPAGKLQRHLWIRFETDFSLLLSFMAFFALLNGLLIVLEGAMGPF